MPRTIGGLRSIAYAAFLDPGLSSGFQNVTMIGTSGFLTVGILNLPAHSCGAWRTGSKRKVCGGAIHDQSSVQMVCSVGRHNRILPQTCGFASFEKRASILRCPARKADRPDGAFNPRPMR